MSLYYQDEYVTLYHGDCLTEHREWLDADVLVTDPPYGGGFRSRHGWRDGEAKKIRVAGDKNTIVRDEALEAWGDKPALVFGFWRRPIPPTTRQMIVWDKRGGNGFSGDYKMPWADATEQIYVIGRDGWQGKRVPAIYSIPSLHSASPERYGHPTPKPVMLMTALLEKCPPGVVADPFAGSGATLVAARNLGRKCVGVELEERYCEIIADRLAQGTLIFEETAWSGCSTEDE